MYVRRYKKVFHLKSYIVFNFLGFVDLLKKNLMGPI